MKKTLIIIAVILAIATGAYFIFKKKQCTDCANKEKEEEEEEESEPVNTGDGVSNATTRPSGAMRVDRVEVEEDFKQELANRLV